MAGGLLLNADWSSLAGIYVEVKDAKGTQEIVLFTQRCITRLPECGRALECVLKCVRVRRSNSVQVRRDMLLRVQDLTVLAYILQCVYHVGR
jgi:hypothetical protein